MLAVALFCASPHNVQEPAPTPLNAPPSRSPTSWFTGGSSTSVPTSSPASMNNRQPTYFVSASFSQPPSASNKALPLRPPPLDIPTSPISHRGSEVSRSAITPMAAKRNVSFNVSEMGDETYRPSNFRQRERKYVHRTDKVYVVSLSILPPLDAIARLDEKLPPFAQIDWSHLKSYIGRKEIPRRIAIAACDSLTNLKIKTPLLRGPLLTQLLDREMHKLKQEHLTETGHHLADEEPQNTGNIPQTQNSNRYLVSPNAMSSAGVSDTTFNWGTKSEAAMDGTPRNAVFNNNNNSMPGNNSNLGVGPQSFERRPSRNNINLSTGGDASPRGANWISSGGGRAEDVVTQANGNTGSGANGSMAGPSNNSGAAPEGVTSSGWMSARWGSVFGGQAATSVVNKERHRKFLQLRELARQQRENTVLEVSHLPKLQYLDASVSHVSHLRVFREPTAETPMTPDPAGPLSPNIVVSSPSNCFNASSTVALSRQPTMQPQSPESASASGASVIDKGDFKNASNGTDVTNNAKSEQLQSVFVSDLKKSDNFTGPINKTLAFLNVSENFQLESLPEGLVGLKYLNMSCTRLSHEEHCKIKGYTSLEVLVGHLSSSDVTKESKTKYRQLLRQRDRAQRRQHARVQTDEAVSASVNNTGTVRSMLGFDKKRRGSKADQLDGSFAASTATNNHNRTETFGTMLISHFVQVTSAPATPKDSQGVPSGSIAFGATLCPDANGRKYEAAANDPSATDNSERVGVQRSNSTAVEHNTDDHDDTATATGDNRSLNATLTDAKGGDQKTIDATPMKSKMSKEQVDGPTDDRHADTGTAHNQSENDLTNLAKSGKKVSSSLMPPAEEITVPDYPHHPLLRLPSSLKHLLLSDNQTVTDISSLLTDCPNLLSLDLSGAARLYKLPNFIRRNKCSRGDEALASTTKVYGRSNDQLPKVSSEQQRMLDSTSTCISIAHSRTPTMSSNQKVVSPVDEDGGDSEEEGDALPKLLSFTVAYSQLRSLDPMVGHPSLSRLVISYSNHITLIPSLPNLTTLLASHCLGLVDLSSLHGHTIIERLDVSDSELVAILPIMPNIRHLDISHTAINDLLPLLQMKSRLQFLSIAGLWPKRATKAQRLEALQQMAAVAEEPRGLSNTDILNQSVKPRVLSPVEMEGSDDSDPWQTTFTPVMEEFPYLEVMHVAGSAFVENVRADPRSASLLTDVYELGSWCAVM